MPYDTCLEKIDLSAAEDRKQEACRDSGADNAGNVGTHCVHEQEVRFVVLSADVLGNACGHGDCGNTGRADEGVDLLAGGVLHDNTAAQTADGRDGECAQTEDNDLDRCAAQEVLSDHRCAD